MVMLKSPTKKVETKMYNQMCIYGVYRIDKKYPPSLSKRPQIYKGNCKRWYRSNIIIFKTKVFRTLTCFS